MKKKSSTSGEIVFLLVSPIHVRNYIETGVLKDVAKTHNCFFLCPDTLKLPPNFTRDHKVIHFRPIGHSQHRFVFNLMMFVNRKKSSTFDFRIKRSYFPKKTDYSNQQQSGKYYVIFLAKRTKKLIKWAFMCFATAPVLRELLPSLLIRLIPENAKLEAIIARIGPDLAIMPSSAYEPDGMELVRICQKLKIKSMFIIDNWDNLSSKTVIYRKPDAISVWGQQTVDHAIKIQGIQKEKIETLGTPRFDQYFILRNTNLSSRFSFKYILFVGTVLEFDEYSALEAMNSILESSKLENGMRIVYRPHPWRQSKGTIDLDHLEHVILDPQIEEAYQTGDKLFQPPLEYYPSLLKNAEFVMGGLTTMLIEALIFYKPFLAITWNDERLSTNMRDVHDNYSHFRELGKVDLVFFNKDRASLSSDFKKIWKSRENINKESHDKQLKYFYTCTEKTFSDRLLNVIPEIIKK